MMQFVVVFAFLVQTVRLEGCNIDLHRVWAPFSFSSSFDFLYPPLENSPDNRNATLPIGATTIISCNGGHFSGDLYKTTKTLLATCNQDFQLEAQDKIINFDTLNCVNFEPVVAKVTTTICASNAILIEIGFQIGLNIEFVLQNRICFDVKNLIPLYANYNLTKSIGFIKSYLSTSYVGDSIYNVSLDFDLLYNNVSYQQQVTNKLLGLPENSTRFINPVSCHPNPGISTPGFCFSMRPLAYRGNFVYISQQYATYRYINVAPQWYFLDYNLDKLERNVIDFVKTNQLDLEVYTGTFGTTTLPHANTSQEIELFLYVNTNNKVIPVPQIFWKLIYDQSTQRATVFMTINNPHLSEDSVLKQVFCEDVSDGITWLTWEKHNVTKGYSYACTYEDARTVISYLPELYVTGILK